MAMLNLVHVTKLFGAVKAVNDLNLEIEEGECFSFLGPSGCGKTTTLRMIAGFEDLDEGELSVNGETYSSSYTKKYLPPEKRNFGMVFQAFAVWPHLTVWENVAFPLKIKKIPKAEIQERVQAALKATSLTREAALYPGKLSGGQQQRIALARAVAINPKVMLLDEPLSNLDPHLREEMRFEIKALQHKFGFTVIYVTHDQAEAMALSDRMLIMRSGQVEQIDTPLTIYNEPRNKFVFSFVGLSSFIPVEIVGGKVFIESARECGEIAVEDLPHDMQKKYDIACRPSEVDFVSPGSGAVTGTIVRRTYLGTLIDYRVKVGNTEIRVQKPASQPRLQEGERCALRFARIHWYERNAE